MRDDCKGCAHESVAMVEEPCSICALNEKAAEPSDNHYEDAKEVELDRSALVIVDRVKAAQITSQATKDGAVAFGQMIVTEIGIRQDFFKSMKDAAFAAHKAVCDKEREKVTQLAQARDDLADKIEAWTEEQDRLAEEARMKAEAVEAERVAEAKRKADAEQAVRERKIKEAADKEAARLRKIREAEEAEAEKKRKLEEAAAAKKAGDEAKAAKLADEAKTQENTSAGLRQEAAADKTQVDALVSEVAESEAAESEPEPESIAPAVEAPVKTKGGTESKVYTAIITDETALIRAVADGKASRRCIKIDQKYLDKLAGMEREDIRKIPGLDLHTETKQGFRKLKK